MFDFAITLKIDEKAGYWGSCRDLPEFNSGVGDTFDEACRDAVDGLVSTLSIYQNQRRMIPVPSPRQSGEQVIRLPLVVQLKTALWNTMLSTGVRKADMCRLLDVAPKTVDRMVDVLYHSKVEQLEEALAALGKCPHLSLEMAS